MKQPGWIEGIISLSKAYEYKNVSYFTHNLINIFSLFSLIAFHAYLAVVGLTAPIWLFIPIASLITGYLVYSYAILVVHEAAHNMFILTHDFEKRKMWNRLFGWMICCPLFTNYKMNWQQAHKHHHAHLLQPADTELCKSENGLPLLKKCIKMFLIPGFALFWTAVRGKGPNYDCASEREKQVGNKLSLYCGSIFWALILIILSLGRDPNRSLVGSVMPDIVAGVIGVGIASVLMVVRQGIEHGHLADEKNILLRSRTTLPRWLYPLIPWGIGYHFEHHLNPHIPWYRLRKAHIAIRERVPQERHDEIYNVNMLDVAKRLQGGNKYPVI